VARTLLTEITTGGVTLQDSLARSTALAALPAREQAFARMLLLSALRYRGWCDALMTQLLKSPLASTPPEVIQTLRLGLTQLFYMDVKPHAALNTSVELAGQRHRNLVNAILRRAQREAVDLRHRVELPKTLLPVWLWDKLSACYGPETATTIAAAHLIPPPLDLTILRPDAATPDTLPEGGTWLPSGTLRLGTEAGRVTDLPGYAAGTWQVQDAAAALPARLFGPSLQGQVIADLCAAPGGKTAQLLAAGATVHAVDSAAPRLDRVRENLARLGLSATAILHCADALTWEPPPGEPLDGILLDAPCSATGTLRRHPDVAWHKTPADVRSLVRLQAQLLQRAAALLRPGGVLVYAVCSLLPEEGAEQITGLLAKDRSLSRLPVQPDEVPGLAHSLTAKGDVRTIPCDWGDSGGIDGFYCARLRKNSV
jgi:16S rRNA (cytosine967-C5)-methyltransferase